MEEFELSGIWWLPSNPDEQVAGIIKFSQEEGILLETIGDFNEQQLNYGSESHEIIVGVTQGKQITLVDCFSIDSTVSFPGFASRIYGVRICLIGHLFENLEQIKFNRCQVKLNDLKYLSELSFDDNYQEEEKYDNYQLSLHIPKSLRANTTKGIIYLKQDVSFKHEDENIIIKKQSFFEIETEEKLLIDNILRQFLNPLGSFVTFVANRANYATELNFLTNIGGREKRIKCVFKNSSSNVNNGRLDKSRYLFKIKDIKQDFGLILQRWFNLYDEANDIINLYFSTYYNSNSYAESRFSSLIQFLESYHRRTIEKKSSFDDNHKARIKEIIDAVPTEHKDWLDEKLRFSHEMSLFERIKDILNMTKETVLPLIGDSDNFAIKVKNIRNYLTHYSDKNQRKLYEGERLFRINQVLNFMIIHCLLNAIGCTHERCTELISCKEDYRYLKSLKFFSKS